MHFWWSQDTDRFVFKRLMLDRLSQTPHVCQLVVRAADAGDLLREAQEVVEDLNREETLYPLILVILSEGLRLVRRPDCFDTALAMPTGRVLDSRNLDPSIVWESYLHSRAAWECGGDIRFARVYGSAWKSVRQADDEALESSCNSLAAGRWAEVCESNKTEWQLQLSTRFQGLQMDSYYDNDHVCGLVEAGLLWRAPGHCRLMPTAWAVRATATLQVVSGSLCRAALINSLLVAEILAWCFQLEAWEREQYDDVCDWSDADERATHCKFCR